jgi:predicted nucleotidyltransferase
MNVLTLLRQHETILEERFGVKRIGIFGSFVRGEERPDSDVDVLVVFQKDKETFDHYMDCKFYLEDLFDRNVDLVIEDTVKHRYKEPILSEVIYA